jgi:hypothetical protein
METDVAPKELGVLLRLGFFKDAAPLALGNGRKAAVNTPALQTLREFRKRPVGAKRLDCACL